MYTNHAIYNGALRPKMEVEDKCQAWLKDVPVLERQVIESLDEEQRKIFDEYARKVKYAIEYMGQSGFEIGLEYGLRLMAYACRSDL